MTTEENRSDRPNGEKQQSEWYIEAIVIQDRTADHADDRVLKSWEGEAETLNDAKEQFRAEHSQKPGVVGFDFSEDVSRVRRVTRNDE